MSKAKNQAERRWGAGVARALAVAAGLGGAFAAPALAVAQTPEEDEIIVTATQRATALQDVPLAVTALTGEQIENAGVRDLQDLTAVAPSLQFNVSENESSATARLRGIGTQGSNPGLESSVGIFIDGVYRARNGVALSDLGEVRQIEILRGPQGTLFGRNTSAGLITVRTEGPNFDEMEVAGEVTYGAFNETRVAGHITGPIDDGNAGFRLFGARSTRDGFFDVMDFNGDTSDTNTRDLWTLRGQMQFEPSATWDLRIIADYTERDEECCAAMTYDPELLNGADVSFPVSNPGAPGDDPLVSPPPGAAGAVALMGGFGAGLGDLAANIANLGDGDLGRRRGFANRPYVQRITDWGVSAELNADLSFGTLTSITSYRDWSFDTGGDIDFTAADLWYRSGDGSAGFGFEIFTQEIRLAGQSGPVDWLVGAFYSNETLERRERITLGNQFNNLWPALSSVLWSPFDPVAGQGNDAIDTALDGAFVNDRYEQTGDSLALFTHEIVTLSPRTHASLGVRFTHEEKDLAADFSTNLAGPGFPAAGGREFLYNNRAGVFFGAFSGILAAAGPAGACQDFTSTPGTAFLGLAQNVYCQGGLRTDLDGRTFMQSREEEELTGSFALHHELNDQVSIYGSASRGYKAGGFNLDRNFSGYVQTGPSTFTITYDTSFEPEFVNALEAGLKSRLFNDSLTANLALFHNEYESFQLNTFNGASFLLASIPEVTSQGAELDLSWRTPVPGLTFQGGFAYVDAKYGPDTGWVADSYNPYSRVDVLGRLPNNRLTNAPEWTVTGAATFAVPVGPLVGLGYLDFRYVSDQITGSDLNPAKQQPEYWLTNARFGLSDRGERWSLELWARNLLDQDYQQVSFDIPFQSGNPNPELRSYGAFLGDPRTVGVTLRARH